jgi:hypothetical protein
MATSNSRSSDPPDGTTLANSSADRIFAPHGEPAVKEQAAVVPEGVGLCTWTVRLRRKVLMHDEPPTAWLPTEHDRLDLALCLLPGVSSLPALDRVDQHGDIAEHLQAHDPRLH